MPLSSWYLPALTRFSGISVCPPLSWCNGLVTCSLSFLGGNVPDMTTVLCALGNMARLESLSIDLNRDRISSQGEDYPDAIIPNLASLNIRTSLRDYPSALIPFLQHIKAPILEFLSLSITYDGGFSPRHVQELQVESPSPSQTSLAPTTLSIKIAHDDTRTAVGYRLGNSDKILLSVLSSFIEDTNTCSARLGFLFMGQSQNPGPGPYQSIIKSKLPRYPDRPAYSLS